MHRQHIIDIGHRLIGAVQDSNCWNHRVSGVWVVMNPAAGLLARHGVVRQVLAQLVRAGAPYGSLDAAQECGRVARLDLTRYPGHGWELGRAIGSYVHQLEKQAPADPVEPEDGGCGSGESNGSGDGACGPEDGGRQPGESSDFGCRSEAAPLLVVTVGGDGT